MARQGKLEPLTGPVEFIPDSGANIVTFNVLDGVQLKWAFRGQGVNPQDNGWRFLSEADTQEYLDDSSNSTVRSFNTIANIEPAVLSIYGAPVGTDLTLDITDGRRTWIDNRTGKPLVIPGA
jgi:hypothetical protein